MWFQLILFWKIQHQANKKKTTCFQKCGWREKSLPRRPQINQFSRDILFSSLVSFAFFVFFFCLLVCFSKWKIYILIHIRLCRWVGDKKKSHQANFRKQDYFLGYLKLRIWKSNWFFPSFGCGTYTFSPLQNDSFSKCVIWGTTQFML